MYLFFGDSNVGTFSLSTDRRVCVHKFKGGTAKGLGARNGNSRRILELVVEPRECGVSAVVWMFGSVDCRFTYYFKLCCQEGPPPTPETCMDECARAYMSFVAEVHEQLPLCGGARALVLGVEPNGAPPALLYEQCARYLVVPRTAANEQLVNDSIRACHPEVLRLRFNATLRALCASRRGFTYLDLDATLLGPLKGLSESVVRAEYVDPYPTCVHLNWEAVLPAYGALLKPCGVDLGEVAGLSETRSAYLAEKLLRPLKRRPPSLDLRGVDSDLASEPVKRVHGSVSDLASEPVKRARGSVSDLASEPVKRARGSDSDLALEPVKRARGADVPVAREPREVHPLFRKLQVHGWKQISPNHAWGDLHVYHDRTRGTITERWNVSMKIMEVNKLIKAVRDDRREILGGAVTVPRGLRVYDAGIEITEAVVNEVRALYLDSSGLVPRRERENFAFLRWADKSRGMPDCRYALQTLDRLGLRLLAAIVWKYTCALKHIFRCSDQEIDQCSLSFARYDSAIQGVRPHIDNFLPTPMDLRTGRLAHYVGPLVAIAMMPGPKSLDFLPFLVDQGSPECFRVTVNQGDILIMDGQARTEYTHSVPNEVTERYTLCFKFKQIEGRQHYYGEVIRVLGEKVVYSIPLRGQALDGWG